METGHRLNSINLPGTMISTDFVILEDSDPDQFLLGNFSTRSIRDKPRHTEEIPVIPLEDISSFREREALVVNDLLYVIRGKSGKYIKYKNNAKEAGIPERLRGMVYELDHHIDINFVEIANQLSSIGTQVSSLVYFEQYFNRSFYGKVVERYCEFLRTFLKDYERIVCNFYDSFSTDNSFSLVSLYQTLNNFSPMGNTTSIIQQISHLYTFSQLIIDENIQRLQSTTRLDMQFENIMKSLKEDLNSSSLDEVIIDSQNSKYIKGGAVLNMLHSEIDKFKGNSRSSKFLSDLYDTISYDYIGMINDWLQFGKIFDPFDEFFIVEANPAVDSFTSYYWTNKFAIKREGLLRQFTSLDSQKKLFLTGKYLAILRECEGDVIINDAAYDPIKSLQDNNILIILNEAYIRANKLMEKMLFNDYQLSKFVRLLNKYFLINEGATFDNFLNNSNHYLKRSHNNDDILREYERAYDIESNDITQSFFSNSLMAKFENKSILESILEIITTHVTDANEILKASNMGSLTELLTSNVQYNGNLKTSTLSSESETQKCNRLAISRFNIEIQIPFPLNQVILDSQKLEYQIIFRNSSLIKFLDKRLEKSWRELGYQTFWTWGFEDMRIRKWIKKCRLMHSKMYDFIRIYSFYSSIDVLESNWSLVECLFKNAANDDFLFDLSDFKFKMTEFLSSSMSDLLLSQEKLASSLYELLSLIFVFHEYVMSLRKTLLLMDESLLATQKEKHNLSLTFSASDKEKKLDSVVKVVDAYHAIFQEKMLKLAEKLSYYGGIDSPKMLILHSKLSSAFKI